VGGVGAGRNCITRTFFPQKREYFPHRKVERYNVFVRTRWLRYIYQATFSSTVVNPTATQGETHGKWLFENGQKQTLLNGYHYFLPPPFIGAFFGWSFRVTGCVLSSSSRGKSRNNHRLSRPPFCPIVKHTNNTLTHRVC
jgi:hypothetical protein